MKYLDLFAGIGGFSRGIEMAGVGIEAHYFSEIDKYAKSIYKRHWPEAKDLGAVEYIRGDEYEPFDLVTFGFPCQDISIAGKRKGLEGSRSNLFYQAMRIIRGNKSRGFILENVQGLFSSNGGKDFIAVLREIADIGLYECQWQLVNTAWFLPQNRERIILAGHIRNGSPPKVFPISETNSVHTGEPVEDSIANCLDSSYHKGWLDKGQRTMIQEDISRTIRAGGLSSLDNKHQHNLIELTQVATLGNDSEAQIRRLTETECELLQGFPRGWTEYGIDEKGNQIRISGTQRYRCLGNAVSTVVIEKIIRKWFIEN